MATVSVCGRSGRRRDDYASYPPVPRTSGSSAWEERIVNVGRSDATRRPIDRDRRRWLVRSPVLATTDGVGAEDAAVPMGTPSALWTPTRAFGPSLVGVAFR